MGPRWTVTYCEVNYLHLLAEFQLSCFLESVKYIFTAKAIAADGLLKCLSFLGRISFQYSFWQKHFKRFYFTTANFHLQSFTEERV